MAGVASAMNVHKVLIALAAVSLLSAACGGGLAGSTASRSTEVAPVAPGQSTGGGQPNAGPAPKPADVAPGAVIQPVPEGPRVQRSARVALEVPHGRFDTVLDALISQVEAAGGYISGSQAQTDDGQALRTGQVSFQVPVDSKTHGFEELLRSVERLGTPLTIEITGTDVSQQYVDLRARLRNAEAQRDAMLALMAQARSVSDTIQIQNQLGQVTGQIEQLNGQIEYVEHSTAYAALAVSIREAGAGPRDEWGLQSAVVQAAHNVVGVVAVLVVVLVTLLPLALLAGVVGLAAWRLWPRLRPARRTPVGPAE